MIKYLTILFLLTVQFSYGRAFYVSSSTGNDGNTGLDIANAWATMAKVSGYAYSNNDSVLLKRGDVWYENIRCPHDFMYFGTYGTGVKPLLSGLQTLTTWVNDGSGVQHATAAVSTSSIVVIDNYPYAMGRYPNPTASNSGYLIISGTGTNSITGPALSTTTNWATNGATVVIRKNHWIIDPCLITSHSGGTINYSGGSGYNPKVSYGYFIQNDIRTLDIFGEWYLSSTSNLSVYFGAELPTTHTIKIGVRDTIFNMSNKNNITVDGIAVEGARKYGFYNQYGVSIVVKNCKTNYCAMGVHLNYIFTSGIIQGDTILNSLSRGIAISGQASTTQYVGYNYIKNTYNFEGMSSSGDGYGDALDQTAGDNATVEYNNIDSTGYIPIVWGGLAGNNINVRYNYVSNYAYVKDDAGGIYTGNGFTMTSSTNRNVYNNIIINGIGADNGTQNYPTNQDSWNAHGVYIDAHSYGNNVYNNTVINCPKGTGIFLHIANNTTVRNNIFYNTRYGVDMERLDSSSLGKYNRNIIYTRNINYANYANLRNYNKYLNLPTSVAYTDDVRNMFTNIDSNYYRSGITYPFMYYTSIPSNPITFQDLPAWKTTIANEANSSYMPTVANTIYYNTTNIIKTIAFHNYNKMDVYGNTYNDNVNINPYSSILLFDNGLSPVPVTTGSALNITLPSTVSLSGTCPNDNITYAWTQVSGPNTAIFTTPTSSTTSTTGLIVGTYIFRLTTTTNLGSSGSNTQTLVVAPAAIVVSATMYILKHRYKH